MEKTKTVKVICPGCGGGEKNHAVLQEHYEDWHNDEDGEQGHTRYQIVQCQGCERIRYRTAAWSTYDIDPRTGEAEDEITVYPEYVAGERLPMRDEYDDIPEMVSRIYGETIKALNVEAKILAGTGLRAIVEAICNDAKVPSGKLVNRIDALVTKQLLAKPQADLLHEERYLGNEAVHEISPPEQRQLEDGLTIVESLLNTMYIAQQSAERMRQRRLKKVAAKTASAPGTVAATTKATASAPPKTK